MTESESVHESDASDIRLIMVALWGKGRRSRRALSTSHDTPWKRRTG